MFRRPVLALSLLLSVSGAMACGSSSTEPEAATAQSIAFASRLQEHGFAWKQVDVPVAGTVTMQLVTVSQADVVMRLGIGTIDGAKCVLLQSTDTAANSATNSPQITTEMAQGSYCVQIADIGNLNTIVDFLLVVSAPLAPIS
jgi:hypothetical protein